MSFNDPMLRAIMRVVAFPMLFQTALIAFAWGAGDPTWLLVAKRTFLLLPACAIVVACWASVLSVLSIPIRSARHEFTTALFVTWWDLGKSVVSFWGGLFRFVAELVLAIFAIARVAAFAVWALIHDVLMLPFALLRHVAGNVVRSPIPWIAVSLTLAWCAIETTIFTYVMSPVVIDTFSNITGETFKESFIRVPLFLFLFFVVMGSYAVLSTFVDAIKSRSFQQIAGILVIECVVIFVEVMFLYREFVDSLVPWFAQYSSNFESGSSAPSGSRALRGSESEACRGFCSPPMVRRPSWRSFRGAASNRGNPWRRPGRASSRSATPTGRACIRTRRGFASAATRCCRRSYCRRCRSWPRPSTSARWLC